jgi:hypothetical protein
MLFRDELGLELDGTPYKYLRISTPADRAAKQAAIGLGEEQQGKIRYKFRFTERVRMP